MTGRLTKGQACAALLLQLFVVISRRVPWGAAIAPGVACPARQRRWCPPRAGSPGQDPPNASRARIAGSGPARS
jgi:hypothetical protein